MTCQSPLWVKSSVFSTFGTLPPCLIPPNFLSAHHFRDEKKRGSAGLKPRPTLLFPLTLLACLGESTHLMGVSAGTPLSPISWVSVAGQLCSPNACQVRLLVRRKPFRAPFQTRDPKTKYGKGEGHYSYLSHSPPYQQLRH